jgi:hypothetical protein
MDPLGSINIGIYVGSVNRPRSGPVPNVAYFRHLQATLLFGLGSGSIWMFWKRKKECISFIAKILRDSGMEEEVLNEYWLHINEVIIASDQLQQDHRL